MTILTSPHTIPAALVKGEKDILGPNRTWVAQNTYQQKFLPFFELAREKALGLKEIESILSLDHEEVNRFLKKHGFSIELEPFDPDGFGVGIVFKWLSLWLIKGMSMQVTGADGILYPGVYMSSSALNMYSHKASSHPAVSIPTEMGDLAFLTMLDMTPRDEFDVIEAAQQLLASKKWADIPELHFPMVDAEAKGSIDWLLGMRTTTSSGRGAFINQALRQSLFQLDPFGAKAEEAVAQETMLESTPARPTPVLIDRPFLAVIVRQGLALPLYTAFLTQESWRQPVR